jgi:hypothetical protein
MLAVSYPRIVRLSILPNKFRNNRSVCMKLCEWNIIGVHPRCLCVWVCARARIYAQAVRGN